MTFNQFLLILHARWRIACAIFGVVVVLAITLAMILPKKYTATASIVIDAKSDPVAGGGGLSEAVMGSYVNTQSDVVTSERVAQKVVKELKLDKDPAFLEGWRNKTHGEGDISISLARFLLDGKRVVAAPPANSSATRQTNVIEITVKWPDPKMAAAIAPNNTPRNRVASRLRKPYIRPTPKKNTRKSEPMSRRLVSRFWRASLKNFEVMCRRE